MAVAVAAAVAVDAAAAAAAAAASVSALCVLLHHSIFFMHASVCPSSAHVQASLSICVYTHAHVSACVCVFVCDPYSQRHSGVKFMA